MRLFCDQCGQEFGERTLRADSKFCSYCGKPLSEYIKLQRGQHSTSPPTSRIFPLPTPSSLSTPTKNAAPQGLVSNVGVPLSASNGDQPLKRGRGRPRKDANANRPAIIDESSTEEDPESEDPGNPGDSGLGKGKRVRRMTQRYVDEVTATVTPAKKHKTSSNTVSSKKKSTTSLEQILNSSPSSGPKPPSSQATELAPLSIAAFKLPPPIVPKVSLEVSQTLFKREEIASLLGGSHKTTFPVPRKDEKATYACMKQAEQEYLPKAPGEHGIIMIHSFPEKLERQGFPLFRKDRLDTMWYYLGTYKVVHSFKVSPAQWLALPEPTRKAKVKGTLRNVWGTRWCEEKRVTPSEKHMLKAFDSGILSWAAHVIECVGWDQSLFARLRHGHNSAHPWGFDSRGASAYRGSLV